MKAIGPPPPPPGHEGSTVELPRAPSRGTGARLWLARHARVDASWTPVAYGALDVPLSAEGEEDTLRLGEALGALPVGRVISSDLARARRLGERVAAISGAELHATSGLREMDRGEWQGLPKEEFLARWTAEAEQYWRDPYRWRAPGGEGDEVLFARAWPEVEVGLAAVDGGTLVLTAHGQLIRVLIGRMLGLGVPESYAHYLDPAHASCLVDSPAGWRVEAQNLGAAELGARA